MFTLSRLSVELYVGMFTLLRVDVPACLFLFAMDVAQGHGMPRMWLRALSASSPGEVAPTKLW